MHIPQLGCLVREGALEGIHGVMTGAGQHGSPHAVRRISSVQTELEFFGVHFEERQGPLTLAYDLPGLVDTADGIAFQLAGRVSGVKSSTAVVPDVCAHVSRSDG
jgi:hypothetical protein